MFASALPQGPEEPGTTPQADPDAHRRMLRRADQTLRTGEEPPGAVSADEVQALIQERLGR
ncbi:DUF6247 family protein [Actinocrispum sp. NPDC049592]|uniref:DUF6247 family protein n=1 Tax=Actinocrispum sp. NPDC049592 TaxID=3154835 RepID=UPI00343D4484